MSATAPLRYAIAPLSSEAHLYEVRCSVADPDPDGQIFSLPAWIPGSYLIRDFARHVVAISASAGGRAVALEKLDKHSWRAAPVRGALTVRTEVYAFDLSVRGAYLDAGRGFFNGACVFLLPRGRENRRCELRLLPPPGAAGRAHKRNWRVATSMPKLRVSASGFGTYAAADYEELIDHPVEMGEFALARFRAGGVAHELAITGASDVDAARLTRDLRRLCAWHIRFWSAGRGSKSLRAPMARYLFLITAVGDGYGGLEHRASSALLCARGDLPRPGTPTDAPRYRGFLGLASHEYFHAWNVKRIRPAAFSRCDLGREHYTTLLWLFEGFTSYYDDLALVRSGLVSQDQYLEILGRAITTHLRAPGRARQTLAEASFDAWTKYYRPDENTPNATVSYYVKGALVALCLDLLIRERSGGRRALDDVMRALWRGYGMRGIGVSEGDFERLAQETTGLRLAGFFDSALHSTRELPLKEMLATHAVRMALRPAASVADRGGRNAGGDAATLARRPTLGVRARAEGRDWTVTHVIDGGAAQGAGVAAGDVIVAADGVRLGPGGLDALLDQRRPGDTVTLHLFRRDALRTVPVRLRRSPLDTCVLALDESRTTPRARRLLQRWLGGEMR